ncbi:MAG: protein jag [Lachnospiraceae bacterium]|nr:protein jag [Lachnospiraceae bacterium]
MKDYMEFSAKTVEDAITEALVKLETTSDKLDYKVIEKGSTGLLGLFNNKPAVIQARKKFSLEDTAEAFLTEVLEAMELQAEIQVVMKEEDKTIEVDIKGENMGALIGKRGQTLDSLQYLTSLVVNKETEEYYRVKVDTENYRARRQETLEKLAKNIAAKVKRTRRAVSLEPMNPYERRVIHSTLQNDKYVITRSDGEEPYRHVVISLKKRERYEK